MTTTSKVTVVGTARPGISPESNPYNIFIYRALDWWLAPPPVPVPEGEAEEGAADAPRPGRLAFVAPFAFCAANNSADLRRLFAPGGRWTITEIVDMELVWRDVFDADVLPMILFAEARPPRAADVVIVRHVDERSVGRAGNGRKARPVFDLSAAPEARIADADLFTPEGRIATRMTPERAPIVHKLRAQETLASGRNATGPSARGLQGARHRADRYRPGRLGSAADDLLWSGATRHWLREQSQGP